MFKIYDNMTFSLDDVKITIFIYMVTKLWKLECTTGILFMRFSISYGCHGYLLLFIGT